MNLCRDGIVNRSEVFDITPILTFEYDIPSITQIIISCSVCAQRKIAECIDGTLVNILERIIVCNNSLNIFICSHEDYKSYI